MHLFTTYPSIDVQKAHIAKGFPVRDKRKDNENIIVISVFRYDIDRRHNKAVDIEPKKQ